MSEVEEVGRFIDFHFRAGGFPLVFQLSTVFRLSVTLVRERGGIGSNVA